jgi:hypothetical protein
MSQINHNHLHLNYFGGSGGFLALHLLLLSNRYVNELSGRMDSVIPTQWRIPDHSKWKEHEIWPDNNTTLSMAGSPKLFFYCNQSKTGKITSQHINKVKTLVRKSAQPPRSAES